MCYRRMCQCLQTVLPEETFWLTVYLLVSQKQSQSNSSKEHGQRRSCTASIGAIRTFLPYYCILRVAARGALERSPSSRSVNPKQKVYSISVNGSSFRPFYSISLPLGGLDRLGGLLATAVVAALRDLTVDA
jgi:hypothetical protein